MIYKNQYMKILVTLLILCINLLFSTARAGNVIGGGDWSEDRIVPDIVKAIQNKEPIILRNPASTRPWQHVLDPLFGYMLLAKNLHQYNFQR